MEDTIYPIGYFIYILRDYLYIFVCLCLGVCMCGGQERTLGVILPLSTSSFEAEFSSLRQKPSSPSDPAVSSLTAGDTCLLGCLACYLSAGVQSPVLTVGKCAQLPQLSLLFIMMLEALSFYFY